MGVWGKDWRAAADRSMITGLLTPRRQDCDRSADGLFRAQGRRYPAQKIAGGSGPALLPIFCYLSRRLRDGIGVIYRGLNREDWAGISIPDLTAALFPARLREIVTPRIEDNHRHRFDQVVILVAVAEEGTLQRADHLHPAG